MTDHSSAQVALFAADRGRRRAEEDTRWFSWAAVAVGVLMVPNGFVVPWEFPIRIGVMVATFTLLLLIAGWIGHKGVVPRGSERDLTVCVALWIGSGVLIAALARDVDQVLVGLGWSTFASVPFFVLAVHHLRLNHREEEPSA